MGRRVLALGRARLEVSARPRVAGARTPVRVGGVAPLERRLVVALGLTRPLGLAPLIP